MGLAPDCERRLLLVFHPNLSAIDGRYCGNQLPDGQIVGKSFCLERHEKACDNLSYECGPETEENALMPLGFINFKNPKQHPLNT